MILNNNLILKVMKKMTVENQYLAVLREVRNLRQNNQTESLNFQKTLNKL
jgi:hypothetical protein